MIDRDVYCNSWRKLQRNVCRWAGIKYSWFKIVADITRRLGKYNEFRFY